MDGFTSSNIWQCRRVIFVAPPHLKCHEVFEYTKFQCMRRYITMKNLLDFLTFSRYTHIAANRTCLADPFTSTYQLFKYVPLYNCRAAAAASCKLRVAAPVPSQKEIREDMAEGGGKRGVAWRDG